MRHYLVLTIRSANFQPDIIPAHKAFLDDLRAKDQLGFAGPFTDKTGGAYILRAHDLAEAESIAFADPVHTSQSSIVTVHEWSISAA